MYFSFIEVHQKRKPRESWVLANPKIVRSPWSMNGVEQGIFLSKEGTKVKREPKPQAWRIVLNESSRIGGKVKKVQAYIQTVSWWDVVDNYLFYRKNHSDDEIQTGWLIFLESQDFDKRVLIKFPDANTDEIWKLFQIKAAPIVSAIINEFKKMEEYKWFKINQKLDAEIKAEKDRKKAEEKRKQRDYQKNYSRNREQNFRDNSSTTGSPTAASLTQDEARIINACYRVMATKLHPDKGGDVNDMKILNGLKDKIRNRL